MVYSSQITEYGWFVQIQSYVYTYIMYARTYPFIIHWLWLLVVFHEILNFHYDVGHQGLDMYPCIQFRHPQCFPLSVTCTCVHMPFKMYCFLLFSEKYIVYLISTMTMFVGSQSLISLPSFMFYACQCYS